MIRSPNEEQKKAIKHNGGVLLSAGAGSGKTFVLVEHIIFKIKEKINVSNIDDLDFEIKIKKFLSEIVIMTFTNKAASELSVRLKERIALELEVSDDKTTILCTKIVMNPKEKTKIKRPKKGKTISNQDFVTLQDEKRAESLEMWRKARQKRQSSTARLR